MTSRPTEPTNSTTNPNAAEPLVVAPSLLDRFPEGVVVADPAGVISFTNAMASKVLGRTRRSLVGMPVDALLNELGVENAEAYQARVRNRGRVRDELSWPDPKRGGRRTLTVSASFSAPDSGGLMLVLGDLSRARRRERAMLGVLEAVGSVTGHAFFVSLAGALVRTLHVDTAAIAELAPGEEGVLQTIVRTHRGRIEHTIRTPLKGAAWERCFAGRVVVVQDDLAERFPQDNIAIAHDAHATIAVPLANASGEVIGAVGVFDANGVDDPDQARRLMDVFAARTSGELERRRQMESMWRADEILQRSALVVREIRDGVIVLGRSGRVTNWNPGAAAMFNMPAEDALGMDARELLAAGSGSFLGRAERERLRAGERVDLEARLQRADGEVFEAAVTVSPLLGRPQSARRKRLEGAIVFCVDTTIRNSAQRRLAQMQKMQAVGQMASGITHDFNNVLAGIRNCLVNAQHALEEGHPALQALSEARELASRAGSVTGSLLALARPGRGVPAPCDIRQLLSREVPVLRSALPTRVSIRAELPDGEYWALCVGATVQHTLMNLAINARDAMTSPDNEGEQGSGEIVITLSAEPNLESKLEPGKVHIDVADNGPGLSLESAEQAFEPFFTTKPVGEGTGIGLPTARKALRETGGDLACTRTGPSGATFRITLPQTDAPAAIDAGADLPRGHIMLIGQETPMRSVLASALESDVGEVTLCQNTGQAERKLQAQPGRYIAVLYAPASKAVPDVAALKNACDTAPLVMLGVDSSDDWPAGITSIPRPFRVEDVRLAVQRAVTGRRSSS